MPQFHETGYGRKFFDHQLPQLIKQLTRIADALEQQPMNSTTIQRQNRRYWVQFNTAIESGKERTVDVVATNRDRVYSNEIQSIIADILEIKIDDILGYHIVDEVQQQK